MTMDVKNDDMYKRSGSSVQNFRLLGTLEEDCPMSLQSVLQVVLEDILES